MKPFSKYSAEELAMEHLFIRWVRFPNDAPIRSFWEGWLKKFPEMHDTVKTAAELVETASDWEISPLAPEETTSIWFRIRTSIGQVSELEPMQSKLQLVRIWLLYYKWYFFALMLLVFTALFMILS